VRRCTLLPALLALALLVPALAPAGEGGTRALAVSASLGGCGATAEGIACRIDVSWSPVEGAERYTVTVARPDGAVLELGSSKGTSTTVWVPYGGAGTYGITVTAWGEEDEEGKRKPIASGEAAPGDGSGGADQDSGSQPAPESEGEEPGAATEPEPATEAPAPEDAPAAPEAPTTTEQAPEPAAEPQTASGTACTAEERAQAEADAASAAC
jgi:hypothetical protein